LPLGAFPWLKIYQKWFCGQCCARIAHSATQSRLAGISGHFLAASRREDKKMKEREGKVTLGRNYKWKG